MMPIIYLKPRKEDSLLRFHPWVFSGAIAYINGMSNDHYYVDMYRNQNIIICVGQGAWEHPMIEDTTRMKELFGYKGINAWVDFWGFDVCHDWPWWKIQIVYFLDKIC